MSEESQVGRHSCVMEWRVVLSPADDVAFGGKRAATDNVIERCVEEFRKRLHEERRKGMVPVGYGPTVST